MSHAAGEAPIEGADRDHLVQALRARGHRQVMALDGPPRASPALVKGLAKPGRLCRAVRGRLDHAMGLCAAG